MQTQPGVPEHAAGKSAQNWGGGVQGGGMHPGPTPVAQFPVYVHPDGHCPPSGSFSQTATPPPQPGWTQICPVEHGSPLPQARRQLRRCGRRYLRSTRHHRRSCYSSRCMMRQTQEPPPAPSKGTRESSGSCSLEPGDLGTKRLDLAALALDRCDRHAHVAVQIHRRPVGVDGIRGLRIVDDESESSR
jgi:hypothetical protein